MSNNTSVDSDKSATDPSVEDDIGIYVVKAEEYIRKNPQGASIQDVARNIGVSRYQANGILGILIGKGVIGVKKIGPVKVHYYK